MMQRNKSLSAIVLEEMDDIIARIQYETPWIDYDEAKKIATSSLRTKYSDKEWFSPPAI